MMKRLSSQKSTKSEDDNEDNNNMEVEDIKNQTSKGTNDITTPALARTHNKNHRLVKKKNKKPEDPDEEQQEQQTEEPALKKRRVFFTQTNSFLYELDRQRVLMMLIFFIHRYMIIHVVASQNQPMNTIMPSGYLWKYPIKKFKLETELSKRVY